MNNQFADLVGQHWSDRQSKTKRQKPSQIRAHASKRVCGIPTYRAGEGVLVELQRRYHGRKFERAISIGAGAASAEIDLLASGLVERFEIFEFAEERIRQAGQAAQKRGVDGRIAFHKADVFAIAHQPYDMVYWRNALHHMPDVDAAVAWSRDNLVEGGVFVMDEYTGPNRLQYTDRQMMLCDHALGIVPDSYFRLADGTKISRKCVKPSEKELIKRDPSESPDSLAIMPAVARHFPTADVINVGGLIYFAGLRRIVQNFDPEADRELVAELLEIDGRLADKGECIRHVAFAEKW